MKSKPQKKSMEIKVTKLTNVELLRKAASMTSGKESKISLKRAYKSMHSLCRTQLFYIEFFDIPQFVVGHLVRHVHAQPFVRSKRVDRGGKDFNNTCRNLAFRVGTCWITKEIDPANPEVIQRALTECDEAADQIERLPEEFDRLAPQSMSLLLSAEELINISRLRLCSCASFETRLVWERVRAEVAKVDPDLAPFMVRSCIYRGGICPEFKSCAYCDSAIGQAELSNYKELFK